MDKVKLVIVGRSSQIEDSIVKPLQAARDRRSRGPCRVPAWRTYFSVISAFDLFVMMRAGSDGSARAFGKVMAMGKPAVVSDQGCSRARGRWQIRLRGPNRPPRPRGENTHHPSPPRHKKSLRNLRERGGRGEKWSYAAQADAMRQFYKKLLATGNRERFPSFSVVL